MKRKILAVVSAMALILSLTACSKTSKEDIKGILSGNKPSNTSSEANNTKENEEKNTESENKEPEETKPEETKADNSSQNESGKFTHGVVTESSYDSTFLGIKAEFGNGWTVYTDDDLADQNNISDMSEKNVDKTLEKTAVLYEMMAGIESGSNVNIVIENLNVTNAGKTITAEEYLELSLEGLESSLSALYDSVDAEIDKTTLCGKKYPCIKVEISTGGLNAEEILIPFVKGNYVSIITFTSLSDEDMKTLMDAFKAVG